ncbi:VTT domain-containing protein [Bacillus sp. CGMCC 1.16541]|uniref:TVP38/TMEM64 family protein n=1 Tax=Bacillus sp. CGMCC 1.16541 TaxID=2185143 RepID=UPI000D73FC09|nr:VTT domain-containing protein [Bacillus sp. CGMCC 1.16541]
MTSWIVQVLNEFPAQALFISIFINILISIFAFVPSFFLTTANIVVFGFEKGLLLSFIGESVGAIVSFWLYRKGLLLLMEKKTPTYMKWVKRFENVNGRKAFLLVLSLRFLPFMPSGLVTILASTSTMGILSFAIASTLGKIPAVFIEALSMNQLLKVNEHTFSVIGLVTIVLIGMSYVKKQRNSVTK